VSKPRRGHEGLLAKMAAAKAAEAAAKAAEATRAMEAHRAALARWKDDQLQKIVKLSATAKVKRARYRGWCYRCRRPIFPGQMITLEYRTTQHAACPPPPPSPRYDPIATDVAPPVPDRETSGVSEEEARRLRGYTT
jgi:hypothetical protein